MVRDPRGGHNRYKINENFFKTWSSSMAYVLGFICADGSLIDARRSSRTQYIGFFNNDQLILYKIRKALDCDKPLFKRRPRFNKFPGGKVYRYAPTYSLRIGNKVIFNDILKLGITPNKSNTLKMPKVPPQYFSPFLRGYFDGDGCLTVSKPPKGKAYRARLVFTSGSGQFINDLIVSIKRFIDVQTWNIYYKERSINLSFDKSTSLKILKFMYSEIEKNGLYLDRKYKRYLYLLKAEKNHFKA